MQRHEDAKSTASHSNERTPLQRVHFNSSIIRTWLYMGGEVPACPFKKRVPQAVKTRRAASKRDEQGLH
jgi:hypothetical protein